MSYVRAGLLFSLLFFFPTMLLATDEERPLLASSINRAPTPDVIPQVHKGRLFTAHMIGTVASSIGWLPLSIGIDADSPVTQAIGSFMIIGGNGFRMALDGVIATGLKRYSLGVKNVVTNGIFDIALTPSYLAQLGFALASHLTVTSLGPNATPLTTDKAILMGCTLIGTSVMVGLDALITRKRHNKLVRYYLSQQ